MLIVACVNGLTTTGITTFDESILKELGGTRADLKLRDTINFWGAALVLPAAGWLIDRHGARASAITGLCILALAVFCYGRASSFMQIYLLHGLFACAIGLSGSLAMIVLVTRLFETSRGLAVGMALAGTSAGAMLMGQIIPRLLDHMAWRQEFGWLALLPVAMAVLVALVVPRLGTSEGTIRAVDKAQSLPLRAALRQPSFWLLALAGFLSFGTILAIFQNIFLHMRDLGFSPQEAGSGLSTLSICALMSKLGTGYLSDRLGSKRLMLICLAVMASGLAVLASLRPDLVFLALALIGLGWGGANTLINYLTILVFGVGAAGRINGVISTAESFGAGIGPVAAALVFDATKSYGVAFSVMVALLMCAGVAVWRVKTAPQPPAASLSSST